MSHGIERGSKRKDTAELPCRDLSRGEGLLSEVLVPLDGSKLAERALPFAEIIARSFGARTTLLQILPPPTSGLLPINPLEWELLRGSAQRYLDDVVEAQAARGHATTPVLEQGRPAHRILDFAREHGIDLIVLNSHGEGGPSRWRLSETAQLLVQSDVASVLVVPLDERGEEGPRLDRLLVALDCSPRAECVLPLAMRLGQAADSEVLLCHVVEQPELAGRLGGSAREVELAGRLVQRNLQEATRYLEQTRARIEAAGVRCQVRVLHGSHAADAIRTLAVQEDIDLILSCAHGSGGQCGQPHGSVAGALAHRPPRPLLIFQDALQRRVEGRSGPRRTPLARER